MVQAEERLLDKLKKLNDDPKVVTYLKEHPQLNDFIMEAGYKAEIVIKSLCVIGEGPIVFRTFQNNGDCREKIDEMIDTLWEVEMFYDTLGGIIGYHEAVLSFLNGSDIEDEEMAIHQPVGIDLAKESNVDYIKWGIEALPKMAMIYPIGGAGDRLSLVDETTGESLPAAQLQFCGRSLLESLIRDVEAWERLYENINGEKVITLIVLMTSQEKNNDHHIRHICQDNHWFGRGKENFFFIKQPLVPVINSEGHWSLSAPLTLTLKPGGHGIIWKLAKDNGAFDWLKIRGRTKALVRQINNPIAGTDSGLFAFSGIGFHKDKAFGYASCPRVVNTAEGMIVLKERKLNDRYQYSLSNIEYTDFAKKGIDDVPVSSESLYSIYPTNTNILFVDLETIEKAVAKCPVPGMLINMKNEAPFIDIKGNTRQVKAGRLESTMQSISDEIVGEFNEKLNFDGDFDLPVYMTRNSRRKTISVTKRSYDPAKPLLETPVGAYYEMLLNNQELLTQFCGMSTPEIGSEESYLQCGPSFIFQYHPALGPLYSIIRQKIHGGTLKSGAELNLELSELLIDNLFLDGSLQIEAKTLDGQCYLKDVTILNEGVDRSAENVYWKGQIKRKESLHVIIHGKGEFFAESITIKGSHTIVVPDGVRVVAYNEAGDLKFYQEKIKTPVKLWQYRLDNDQPVKLEASQYHG